LPQWAAMGKPKNPTPAQAEQLNRETALPVAEKTILHNGVLHLNLSQNALVLVQIDGAGH
jgi:xylan 1,4-beta-xylosidase